MYCIVNTELASRGREDIRDDMVSCIVFGLYIISFILLLESVGETLLCMRFF